jgi:HSP20 family molecular chaperone IbpA
MSDVQPKAGILCESNDHYFYEETTMWTTTHTTIGTKNRTPAPSTNPKPSTKAALREELLAPFDSLVDDLFRDMNTDLYKAFGASPFGKAAYPKADVIEYDAHVEIIAELAGFKKEQIKVEVVNDKLIISGEQPKEPATTLKEGGRYLLKELKRSKFVRTFLLGEQLNHDKINAQFHDGILTVTLPKRQTNAEPQSKQIEIK